MTDYDKYATTVVQVARTEAENVILKTQLQTLRTENAALRAVIDAKNALIAALCAQKLALRAQLAELQAFKDKAIVHLRARYADLLTEYAARKEVTP
jgi:hypothetical protein